VALLAARRVRSVIDRVVAPLRPAEVVTRARRAPLADRAAGRAPPLALVTMA